MKHLNIVMVPNEFVMLQSELSKHPDLLAKFAAMPEIETFSQAIAAVCTEVGVVVHGSYTGEDLQKLATILTEKLYARRGAVITSPGSVGSVLVN